MVKSPESHPGFVREKKAYNPHKEHWEVKYSPEPGKNRQNQIMGGDFDPMQSKHRYKMYTPVNETDT